jgi:hypothetical protein
VAVLEDGRTVAPSVDSIAVISADGQECHQLSIPPMPGEDTRSEGRVAGRDGFVYLATYWGAVRYTLPQE